MNGVEAFEINVAAVHDVDGVLLELQFVQKVHIMCFGLGYEEIRWDVSFKIQLGMDFNSGFLQFEVGPFEGGKTEIDDRGIEDVDGVIKFDRKIIVLRIESADSGDEVFGEVTPDAPVAELVGTGEGREREMFGAEAQVVELVAVCIETGNDATETLKSRKLAEHKGKELVTTGEIATVLFAMIFGYEFVEVVIGNVVRYLGENVTVFIHR